MSSYVTEVLIPLSSTEESFHLLSRAFENQVLLPTRINTVDPVCQV